MGVIAALAAQGCQWVDMPWVHPVHRVLAAERDGDRVETSGQVALVDGQLQWPGKVGEDVSLEQAQEAAKFCALNCLYAIGTVVPIDWVVSIKKLMVYVNGAPGFENPSEVADGATDFLISLFEGDGGKHTRTAVVVAGLPHNACVEISMVVEVREKS